jgi:hypothetical protein
VQAPTLSGRAALPVTTLTGVTVLSMVLATQPMGWRALAAAARNRAGLAGSG